MSGGRASPFGLSRKQADSPGWRSNNTHRDIYSRFSDLRRCGVIHIPSARCAQMCTTALDRGGIDLPNMKRTAQILAEIALGWEAGA